MPFPSEEKLAAVGKLILRAVPAVLMLGHGLHKVVHGISGIRSTMIEAGLPGFVAPGVYLGEVVAPLLMLVGLGSRPAGLVFAFNMVVAILTAHTDQIFRIGKHGEYRLELQLLYMTAGIVVALLGPGPYSLSRGRGRLG
jgi:putative oxidoreductase